MEFEKAFWIVFLFLWEMLIALLTAWPFCFIFLFRKYTPISCSIVAVMATLFFLNVLFFKLDFKSLGELEEDWFQYYIKVCFYLCPFSLAIGFIEYNFRLTRSKTTGCSIQVNPSSEDISLVGKENLSPTIKRAWYRALVIVLCVFGVRVVPGVIHSQQIYALENDLKQVHRSDPNNLKIIEQLLTRNGVDYHLEPDGIFWARVPTKNPFIPFEQELFVKIKTNENLITSFNIFYSYTAP